MGVWALGQFETLEGWVQIPLLLLTPHVSFSKAHGTALLYITGELCS